jgi:hypothetical protein
MTVRLDDIAVVRMQGSGVVTRGEWLLVVSFSPSDGLGILKRN